MTQLDALVSRCVAGAEKGTLTIIAGASDEDCE
ncbi:hypothetical protein [Roseobacter sp.]